MKLAPKVCCKSNRSLCTENSPHNSRKNGEPEAEYKEWPPTRMGGHLMVQDETISALRGCADS